VGVYRRLPPRLTRRHFLALDHAERPWLSLVTSGLALEYLEACLPGPLLERWKRETLIVSSERLLRQANAAGFFDVHEARSALTEDLIACACAMLARHRL
jgi:uroporphyrinogen-III synthase